MSYGVTEAGFIKKTFNDIVAEMEDQARGLFGEDVDLSEYGEVGIMIQLFAKQCADWWEGSEDVYYARYIDTAVGVNLDRAVALGGISRVPAKKAGVVMTIYGTESTVVPIGFLFQTRQGIQFESISSGAITATGVELDFRAVVAGSTGVVPAESIIEIVTPEAGIVSGVNFEPSAGGTDLETDAELRARYKERGTAGGSSVPAITNRLLNVENISTVTVYENATNTTDANGRPPHSIECVLSGTATDAEIAQAIYESKPAGIETIGTESYVVIDDNGDPHTIKWSYPEEIEINVTINVTTDSAWVSGNEVTLKTRAVQVIGGVDTVGDVAIEYEGLGVGKSVKSWAIIANFDDIPGIDEVEVLIAIRPTSPSSSATIPIDPDQMARTLTAYITVNT